MQKGCTVLYPLSSYSLTNADETEQFNFSLFIFSNEASHVTMDLFFPLFKQPRYTRSVIPILDEIYAPTHPYTSCSPWFPSSSPRPPRLWLLFMHSWAWFLTNLMPECRPARTGYEAASTMNRLLIYAPFSLSPPQSYIRWTICFSDVDVDKFKVQLMFQVKYGSMITLRIYNF
jgi:hypothetical protein